MARIFGLRATGAFRAESLRLGIVGTFMEKIFGKKKPRIGDQILRELRQLNEGIKTVSDASARIETALAGIQGDIDGLKEAAADLQTALDEALAAQGADVQAQIEAAVAEAKAAFDSQLDALASKLEEVDAQTAASDGGDVTDGEPPQ